MGSQSKKSGGASGGKRPLGKKEGDGGKGLKPNLPAFGGGSRTLAFWFAIILMSLLAYNLFQGEQTNIKILKFTEFLAEVEAGRVEKVHLDGREITGSFKGAVVQEDDTSVLASRKFKTSAPEMDFWQLVEKLRSTDAGVEIEVKPPVSKWWGGLWAYLPIVFFLLLWLFLMRQMQGGGNRAFSFGKSKAKLLTEDKPDVTFKDVAGIDEAKEEVQEIIEFLKDPAKFQKLGGKIPKGALLLGPPGTGKTLLARAIAGEAGVPFFSMSGSDFVEMFVGVGASRVRDLFEQGKKNAPCIIFIDEIDAVGRHRGAGLGGGHDEREQTLNQLLVEMDGFDSNEGVILVAATNRPDVLDPALLRPGRFDRQIVVDRPDLTGRLGIVKVHVREIPVDENVDFSVLARGTPGFSGADIASMVNEAALLAARRGKKSVEMIDFEDARDKVLMGTERKSLLISEEEKKVIAYHEAGHALVTSKIPGMDPVHKVSIIPRGRALGVTQHLPIDEKYLRTKEYYMGLLATMLGGRAAETLIFEKTTNGSANDIEQASGLARKMVCEWGMSDTMGPLTFGKKQEEIFLGREIATHRDYSEQTAVNIDKEVRRLVTSGNDRANAILEAEIDILHAIADKLLERECITGADIRLILQHKELPDPPSSGEKSSPNGDHPEDMEGDSGKTDPSTAEIADLDAEEAEPDGDVPAAGVSAGVEDETADTAVPIAEDDNPGDPAERNSGSADSREGESRP